MRNARTMLAGMFLLAGCGSASEAEKPDAGTPPPPEYVAVQGDFANFNSWQSFDGGTTASDGLNTTGQRMLYLNHAPPHGSEHFPLGTIIVKTTDGAQTFAMAKRGGHFNPQGDHWEWFELAQTTGGDVQIVWRGEGPTGTLGYGTEQPTGCNSCHLLGFKNDWVAGDAIQLSSF